MVNLSKGASLSLVKADGSSLSKVRVGISWDVASGVNADLDLFVVSPSKQVAYFGDKTAIAGIQLSDDNRTGAGDGDDEFAKFDAAVTTDGVYTICVNSFTGTTFDKVSNAKATVYNDEDGTVLATFELAQGATNTGIIVGTLTDAGNSYVFTAKGDFVNGDVNEITASI